MLDSFKYTTEVDATTRLKSVTHERNLDEFLNTAQLAATDFTAGRSIRLDYHSHRIRLI